MRVIIWPRAAYVISPRLGELEIHVDTMYMYQERPPRTITISMPEIPHEKFDEFKRQLGEEKGALFELFHRKEKEALRRDIEEYIPAVPHELEL